MIRAVAYGEDGVETFDGVADARAAPGTTWVHADTGDAESVQAAADEFGVHPLTVEDVLDGVRPKTEEFDGYTFVMLKTARLVPGDRPFDEVVRERPVGVFLGDDWLMTLTPDTVQAVERVWTAVERREARLLARGPDFTAYRIVDGLVDEYFDLLDHVETDIEDIEEEVLVSTTLETLERINGARRDLLAFRKLAWPTREAVGLLARGDPEQVHEETEKYYRDVYDHLVQVVDLTETYRDLTNGARDIYLNTLSQSTNEVMKRLTVVATIFLPLTFVAGVYGMNFGESRFNMPELTWTFGYPAAMLGMLGVGLVMLWYFHRMEYL